MNETVSVVTEVINQVGWIRLNRPRVINSLNLDMVQRISGTLREWKKDDRISVIVICGEGERGLCAGGDMRTFYELRSSGVREYAEQFFSTEYVMDYEIHQYDKPIVVYMNGIVMGGGVGFSIGASHRIVTETTKWAMPEMNIGFFPDVGASYFLSRMPGHIGRYLALTSTVIGAGDVLKIGAADYFMEGRRWEQLKQAMNAMKWTANSVREELRELLKHFGENCLTPDSTLPEQKINQHFQYETLKDILSSLKKAGDEGDEWARQTAEVLLAKSPLSLMVTLRQLQEGKRKSLRECFEMELNMAMRFMDSDNFYEGVRSVLIDKDRNPRWTPASWEDILEEEIASFFHASENLKWLFRTKLDEAEYAELSRDWAE